MMGLDVIAIREIALKKTNAGLIIGNIFVIRLISGFICWSFLIAGFILTDLVTSTAVILAIILGSSLLFQAADSFDLWFQSQSQSRRTVTVKIYVLIFTSALKIILILTDASLISLAIVYAIDGFLVSLGMILSYIGYKIPGGLRININRKILLLKESWPIIISGISIVIYLRIDQIMIEEMLGAKSLGIYSAVISIATAWQFLPIIISTSISPYLSKKKLENEFSYDIALGKVFSIFAVFGWIISILIATSSSILVGLIFGSQYEEGSSALAIYVFTNLTIGMGVAQNLWIINEGRSKIMMYKTILGALICICANWILIPVWGLNGAAISSILAEFSSSILLNYFISKKIFYIQLKSLTLIPFIKLITKEKIEI